MLLQNWKTNKYIWTWIEQKGMTFDHYFGYSFPLYSSLLRKREEEKDELSKIVNKGHAFLLDKGLRSNSENSKGFQSNKSL